ncbi:MAG TPA: DegV family protein [Firmicutes bacterium]|uniref:DegV family protein n=1 Tax=Capillibacterium thermochitinicola TaxID=2699427 RepID=A0A8J6LSJ0_9FIRM|nr:DegV family protein [Capillibacterium thermochitinicola]MBA2133277.1 DegV family protein [Capillibacterium thermochitinicola]HHW12484.1 DegV family protein [Bacillota bacterium]
MSIKIVTDSTADLSPELKSRYGIEVIPLTVHFGEEVYYDGIDLTQDEFLEKVNTSPHFPKTGQATPAAFLELFRRLLAEGHEILYVGISSDLSGTYASACLAAQELADAPIATVDSRNLSMGIGVLALHAAEMAEQGTSLQAIADRLRAMTARVRTSFIVDTLDFLYKGGRLTRAQALIGNVLQIHPRIEVVDGKMCVPEKIRGSKSKAKTRLLEWATANKERIDDNWIAVTHCRDEEAANDLAAQFREMELARNVVITKAGAVISTHCGPGTVGIIYVEKEA